MEQNVKYIIETCGDIQKYIDGHLIDAIHQLDPSITKDLLSNWDYWSESFDGLLDYDECENCCLFGNDNELPFSLL